MRKSWFFHTADRFTLPKPYGNVTSWPTHQYGVPMKDFLLAIVAVILAATPKSAGMKSDRIGLFILAECDVITFRQKGVEND